MQQFLSWVSEHKALFYVLLLSLAIKILLLLQDPVIHRDAVVYLAAAQSFAEGMFEEGSRHYRMPLYPLMLTAIHFVIPDWIWAGRLFNTLILLSCLFPFYFITLRLFDKQSALAATLLFAVLPVFNSPVNSIIRDPLFLLLALCVLALLAYQIDRITPFGLVGIAFLVVLATLIRIEGVLFFVLVPLLILWNMRQKIGFKLIFLTSGILLLFVLVSLAVLWGFSQSGFGTQSRFNEVFVWIKGFINLELFSGYVSLQAQLKEFQEVTPYSHLRNNLVQAARYYAPLVYLIGLFEILIKEIFPTTLLAIWALRWRDQPAFNTQRSIIVWPWIVFLLLNLLFCLARNFIVTRYMWIPIVLSLPFAGYGISLWWQRFEHRRIVLVTLILLFFAAPATKTLGDLRKEDRESIRQAGQWVKKYDPDQQLNVLFNDSRLTIYADRPREYHRLINVEIVEGDIIGSFLDSDADLVVLHFSDSENLNSPDGYDVLASFEDKRSNMVVVLKNKLLIF